MPRFRVIIHPLADDEAEGARAWYARRSTRASLAFEKALSVAVDGVAINPLLGTPHGRKFRWVKLRRFPYVVYYQVFEEKALVQVLAVAHARRRLNYWRTRSE